MHNRLLITERENGRIDELAERKLTRKTLFEFVMAVVDFVLALGVFVVATGFGQFLFQMPERVKRRIQYREQYCKAEEKLYDRMFFHKGLNFKFQAPNSKSAYRIFCLLR